MSSRLTPISRQKLSLASTIFPSPQRTMPSNAAFASADSRRASRNSRLAGERRHAWVFVAVDYRGKTETADQGAGDTRQCGREDAVADCDPRIVGEHGDEVRRPDAAAGDQRRCREPEQTPLDACASEKVV